MLQFSARLALLLTVLWEAAQGEAALATSWADSAGRRAGVCLAGEVSERKRYPSDLSDYLPHDCRGRGGRRAGWAGSGCRCRTVRVSGTKSGLGFTAWVAGTVVVLLACGHEAGQTRARHGVAAEAVRGLVQRARARGPVLGRLSSASEPVRLLVGESG
jgi:hypothetical protein